MCSPGADGVRDLGLDPGKAGENSSRHLSQRLQLSDHDTKLYEVETMLHSKKENMSLPGLLPLRLPHEVLAEVYEAAPNMLRAKCQDPSDWNFSSFVDHEVVRSNEWH